MVANRIVEEKAKLKNKKYKKEEGYRLS
jgi:hypothetical protein